MEISIWGSTGRTEGTLTYADGSRYKGNFKNDIPDGKGTLFEADPEKGKFRGEFKEGKKERGAHIYPDGNKDWLN